MSFSSYTSKVDGLFEAIAKLESKFDVTFKNKDATPQPANLNQPLTVELKD